MLTLKIFYDTIEKNIGRKENEKENISMEYYTFYYFY